MPTCPVDRDIATVRNAVCDNVHALGCAFVGERGDGRSDSGYGCFTVRGYGVDGLACRETVRDTHRESESNCLRSVRR